MTHGADRDGVGPEIEDDVPERDPRHAVEPPRVVPPDRLDLARRPLAPVPAGRVGGAGRKAGDRAYSASGVYPAARTVRTTSNSPSPMMALRGRRTAGDFERDETAMLGGTAAGL